MKGSPVFARFDRNAERNRKLYRAFHFIAYHVDRRIEDGFFRRAFEDEFVVHLEQKACAVFFFSERRVHVEHRLFYDVRRASLYGRIYRDAFGCSFFRFVYKSGNSKSGFKK